MSFAGRRGVVGGLFLLLSFAVTMRAAAEGTAPASVPSTPTGTPPGWVPAPKIPDSAVRVAMPVVHVAVEAPPPPPPPFFLIGALVGIGFPRPLSAEVLSVIDGVLGVGLEYGALPWVELGGVGVSTWAVTLDTRVFPFRGAFFIGARGGYQRINISASAESRAVAAEYVTWFVNPRAGFQWNFRHRLVVATEIGGQFPVTSSFSAAVPDVVAANLRQTSGVRTLSGVLPTIDLVRVGFLF